MRNFLQCQFLLEDKLLDTYGIFVICLCLNIHIKHGEAHNVYESRDLIKLGQLT